MNAGANDDSGRSRFDLCDAADIDRLIIHLFTHWNLPVVQVQLKSLPAVLLQRAQHRLATISEARHGAFAASLAATAFLVGIILMWSSVHSMIWTSRQLWQNLGLLAVATLYAGLIGAALELAYTRMRLMLMLRRLRQELVADGNFEIGALSYRGVDLPREDEKKSTAVSHVEASLAHDNLVQRSVLSRPGRPKLILHDNASLRRLVVHLLTHAKLPHVVIGVDGVAPVDVQRAQHRASQLAEACNCVLGASLAGAVFLVGPFSVELHSSRNWQWWVPESWGALGLVPVAALCAAAIGVAIEMVWTRISLIRVLRGVRHRLGA